MKKLSDIIKEELLYESIYNGISEYFINEAKGIFNECENITDILIEKIITKLKEGENEIKIILTKNEYPNLFIDTLKCDVYFSKKYHSFDASTNPDKNGKAIVIGLYIPIDKPLELFDLKERLFHELTHWFTSEEMLKNSTDNFFLKNSIQPKSNNNLYDENNEELYKYILYRLNDHEQNAFNSMIKVEIDRIGSTDPNKIFLEIQKSPKFNILFYLYWLFNQTYYENIFKDNNLEDFPKYYRKYMLSEYTNNLSEAKIFTRFKRKINKAFEKFLYNLKRMINKYANKENFKNLKYKNEIINPSDYIKFIEAYTNYKPIFLKGGKAYSLKDFEK